MSLTLYTHPLSSYVHKVLIPLYENATPFTPHPVFLGDPKAAAEYKAIWPMGKLPSLRDKARDRLIPESTAIIEYLDHIIRAGCASFPKTPNWRGRRGFAIASTTSWSTRRCRRS